MRKAGRKNMAKLSINDLKLKGKNGLVRVDFNVALYESMKVTDDFRIREALPTIQKIMKEGGRTILCSHLGRPKGKRVDSMSLKPAVDCLGQLLGKPVKF